MLALAVLSAACSDRSADFQRQVMSLREELERAHADLRRAEGEIENARNKTTDAPASSAPAELDRAALESSYEAAARTLREQVQQQLSDAQIEGFTLYRPQFEEFPHRSEFSMEVREGERRLRVDRIPVKATAHGQWVFPSVAEVVARIRQAGDTRPAGRGAQVAAEDRGTVQAGVRGPLGAEATVVIDWGEANRASPPRSAASRAPDAAPPAAPAPPDRPAAPAQVMPAQRDVQIKF